MSSKLRLNIKLSLILPKVKNMKQDFKNQRPFLKIEANFTIQEVINYCYQY